MKYSCIIVEDEPVAREKLEEFVSEIDFLELVKSFSHPLEVPKYISDRQIDLMFLDIEMGKFSGLDLLACLDSPPKVIITTAYEQYAINSYDFNVVDYILKPYNFGRFVKAVNKIALKHNNDFDTPPKYIFVKTENRIKKIHLEDILFIEGMKDYLRIVTEDEKIMTLMNFKNILNALPATEFVRAHNSFIVSMNKIDHIERDRIRIGSQLIPISKGYRTEFYKQLNINLI